MGERVVLRCLSDDCRWKFTRDDKVVSHYGINRCRAKTVSFPVDKGRKNQILVISIGVRTRERRQPFRADLPRIAKRDAPVLSLRSYRMELFHRSSWQASIVTVAPQIICQFGIAIS